MCDQINLNKNPVGLFKPACQLPFAFQIHIFIRKNLPIKFSRFLATVWFFSTAAFCCLLCTIFNVLFSLFWLPFCLVVPSDFFNYILEFGTSLIFGVWGKLLLLFNCFTWPVFEYRGQFPTATKRLFRFPSHCSDASTAALDRHTDSTKDLQSSEPSDNSSLCSDNNSPVTTIRNRRHGEQPNDDSPQFQHSRTDPYRPRGCVMMSNHLSNADGFILRGLTLPWPLKFIYKSEINRVPFLGPCMIAGREIPLKFNGEKGMSTLPFNSPIFFFFCLDGWGVSRAVVTGMMDRVKQLISIGIPILVFPEGLRRRFNRMGPFRTGFFKFCIESGVDVYPSGSYADSSSSE